MASIQIPNLPAVIGLSGAELFEGVQAGSSVKISLDQIIAATRGGTPATLPIPVSLGGTGATTLTGYVQGNGTAPFTASPTIPNTDITGLGTMSTQNANAVAITGGTAALTGVSSVTVNSATTAFTITQTGAGNAFLVEDSASPDSSPFIVDASGNVGIGTSLPTSLGTGITTLELKGNSASQTDRAGGINFMRYDGNPGMYVYHADDASYISSLSTYPLLIETNGSERMRITAAGNVGIGGSVPASNPKLSMYGGIRFLANETAAATYTGIGSIASDTVSISTSGSERITVNASGVLILKAVGVEGGDFRLNNIGDASVGLFVDVSIANNGRVYQTENNSTLQIGQLVGTGGIVTLHTAAAERMRIDAAGNFLLNQTTDTTLYDNTSGTGVCYRNGASFDILSASDNALILNRTGSDGGIAQFRKSGTTVGNIDVSATSLTVNAVTTLALQTASATRFQIGSAGQWGIGGATYGTAGQAFVSGGAGAAPSWTSVGTFTTVTATTSVLSTGAGGIGYATGAGVAVTQLTSRTTTTPTTGAKTTGAVTLFTAVAVVNSYFSFTVPNTAIAITDTVVVTVRGATNTYVAFVTAIVAATSFNVTMASVAGTASDTPIVNFTIIKGVSA